LVMQSELGRLDMEWVAKLRAKSEKESAWLLAHRLREDGFCAYWGEYNADRRCQVLGASESLAAPSKLRVRVEIMGSIIIRTD
jgi:hypothetical protein